MEAVIALVNSCNLGCPVMNEEDYRKLALRVHVFPKPPGDLDPRSAPNHTLARYGLLERPDERLEPEKFAFRSEMFRVPLEYVQPQFFPEWTEELRCKFLSRPSERPTVRATFAHAENSRNWSGAYITPLPRPGRFVQMIGSYVVPRATVPQVLPEGADPLNQAYHSSTWIGFGGHRSYNTLPQIGTRQSVHVVGGTASEEYVAWWQWWNRDDPGSYEPIDIPDFDVAPGDRILACITVEAPDPGDIHFIIVNLRTGRHVTFKVIAPANIRPVGTTAEWIHERPTDPVSRKRFLLPHCSDVEFRSCLAWSASDLGMPMSLQVLSRNARLIRMSEIFPRPHRSALVSYPKRTQPTELTISYREAAH